MDNPSQGLTDNWAGVSFAAEDDTPKPAKNRCKTLATNTIADNDISVACPGAPGLVETTNDGSGDGGTGGTLSILAMYPRQPFDIAGRTGTAVFSATDDTEGSHGAWPTWVYTSQPVPAPYGFLPPQVCATLTANCSQGADNAKYSIGVDFDGTCLGPCGPHYPSQLSGSHPNPNCTLTKDACSGECVTVGDMWVTVNYVPQVLNMRQDGCVLPSRLRTGMDHFKIQINTTGIYVYGSSYATGSAAGDAGHAWLLADAEWNTPAPGPGLYANPALPLTRGLTWMEDVHYNADKFSPFPGGDGGGYDQALNSFEWDNFGFDGPVLPRDAAYDVPDNTTPGPTQTSGYGSTDTGYPTKNLGYIVPEWPGTKTFTFHGVTTANATGGLVTFTWDPWDQSPAMQVSVNGHQPIEISDPGVSRASDPFRTEAISIPLSDVVNGTNTLTFSDPKLTADGYGETIANIDLIVQGAGGTVAP